MMWITAHAEIPGAHVAAASRHGLYGSRTSYSGAAESKTPLRLVLPAGTLA
jgi:hypothetical protein